MGTALLQIDLDALVANWRTLDAMSARGCETAAVVKADGYGLGAAPVARALARGGARSFFVAVAEEGAAVRAALGPGPDIYVFSGHMEGDAAALREHRLIPLLNSVEQMARHFGALPGRPFGVQLDTGMNRLGLEGAEWAAARDIAMGQGPALVISHLACADEPDHAMNARQRARFAAMTQGIDAPRSLGATGGVLLGRDYHHDMVRPGIGLYGGAPFGDGLPVARLSLPVIQTRAVEAGETVGYGNAWRAEAATRIATLSAGYADGLIRALGCGGIALYAGDAPCPLVGRVSMDLLTVDVGHLDADPQRLDILCDAQGIDDLARAAGTIGYEVLTALGGRYERRYKGRDFGGGR